MRRVLLFSLLFFSFCGARAQKSLFVTYNVEQGLGQSQATGLAQDRFRNLWITHLGGISRFDGKHFKTYTTADGLQNNFCNAVVVDRAANVWIGTHTGLSVYNGHTFKNYVLSSTGRSSVVGLVQCDRYNRVWAVADGELYQADVNHCLKVGLPFNGKRLLAIGLDAQRDVLAVIEGAGIFALKEKSWQLMHALDFLDSKDLRVRKLYTSPSGTLYFVSNKGIFLHRKTGWTPLSFGRAGELQALNVLEDEKQRLWVATTKGAYLFSNDSSTHFNNRTGFTDHLVSDVLKDNEGNYWFSTFGSGIIKYSGSRGVYFDKEILKHVGASGITKTSDGAIWFGTYGDGLRRYDGSILKEYRIPDSRPAAQIINFCLADKNDGIWVGTQGGGLWYFRNGTFKEISPNPAVGNRAFFSGHLDGSGRMIAATAHGVYEFAEGRLVLVGNEKIFANTVAFIGQDSILVGTPHGVQLLWKNKEISFPVSKELAKATVLSIVRNGNQLFIGSADKGLFVVSLVTGETKQFDMRHGLSSNCIYAIAVDRQERIWLSTGHYLNHFRIDAKGDIRQLVKLGKSKGILSPEGNTNSLFIDDSVLWVGNLNGLNRIDLAEGKPDTAALHVMITGVRLFSTKLAAGKYNDSIHRYYPVPAGLRLPHDKNHLTFTFHAVSLSDPDEILYQYKIKGIDDDFSAPTANNQVVYSNLPPGNHTLQVRAISQQGVYSPVTEYSFIIQAPFYQYWYFQLLLALLVLRVVAYLVHLRNGWKENKKREKEEIKKQEQLLVRRRTAEDFHDDIGNKLTRINVLTEVLKNKVRVNDDTKILIEQIQENTTGLYSSSKDLIWSLSNDEGTLHDLAARLIHFGQSLFQNTGIDFEYNDQYDALSAFPVEPETSRNVTLIVKEALNNALKHGGATRVRLSIALNGNQVSLTVSDNGKGYEQTETSGKGYGIGNMKSRAERIGASLKQVSSPGKGTIVFLQFNLPDNHSV